MILSEGMNVKVVLFPEGEDNYQAYAVRSHRHYPEILQTPSDDNEDLDVLFVPHLSSMTRGISR